MDPVERARELLPGYVQWTPTLFYAALALALGLALTSLGMRIAVTRVRKLGPDAHWTERARHVLGARSAIVVVLIMVPCTLVMSSILFHEPLMRVPETLHMGVAFFAAFVAGIPARRRALRFVRPEADARRERRGAWARLLVLYPHLLIVLIGGLVMPADFGPWLFVTGVLVVAGVAGAAAGAGLDAAQVVGLARPASARLARIVAETAGTIGAPAPRAFELVTPLANAFAMPLRNRLAFTEGVLDALDDEQIAAVAAHEIGHLQEPRRVALLRGVVVLSFASLAFIKPIAIHFGPVSGLLVLIAWLVGLVLFRRVARRMEERADAVAHAHQHDEGTYARALERIYEVNVMPAVTGRKGAAHPDLWDRMIAAGVTPSYPRPAPPARGRGLLAMAVCMILGLALVLGVRIGLVVLGSIAPTESVILATIALSGGDSGDLDQLASVRGDTASLESAATLREAASDMAPASEYYALRAAIAVARVGRCEEAKGLMHRAAHPAPDELASAQQWIDWCYQRTSARIEP